MSPSRTISIGRGRTWFATVATGATLLVAGCSGDDGGGEAVSSASTAATTVATTAPSEPAPAPSAPASTATSSGAGSTSQPTTQQRLPFVADTAPDVSNEREGYPVLVSVTQGEHPGYRRYVFTFRHVDPEGHQPWRQHARPQWDARYVPASEAVMAGSGDPVANAGARAHLRIQFSADMHTADGRSSLERSVSDEPPDLVFGGDFENQVTWFYGAAKEQPFRVFYVGEGRVAVDIVR